MRRLRLHNNGGEKNDPHPGLEGNQKKRDQKCLSNTGPPADGAVRPWSEDGEFKTRRRDGFRSATIHKFHVVTLNAPVV